MEKKEKKENKHSNKKPIDKGKLIQTIVIILIIAAMLISFAASLIYSLIY